MLVIQIALTLLDHSLPVGVVQSDIHSILWLVPPRRAIRPRSLVAQSDNCCCSLLTELLLGGATSGFFL